MPLIRSTSRSWFLYHALSFISARFGNPVLLSASTRSILILHHLLKHHLHREILLTPVVPCLNRLLDLLKTLWTRSENSSREDPSDQLGTQLMTEVTAKFPIYLLAHYVLIAPFFSIWSFSISLIILWRCSSLTSSSV